MSTTDETRTDTPTDREIVEERLGEYRDELAQLAALDTPLSDDAERALELLEEGDQS